MFAKDKHSILIRKFVNYDRKKIFNIMTRDLCYKTFYCGNLPPFHGNSIILCYILYILPWKLLWNGSKLPLYINPRARRVIISAVIYRCIVPML
jgi:hypothetical protein